MLTKLYRLNFDPESDPSGGGTATDDSAAPEVDYEALEKSTSERLAEAFDDEDGSDSGDEEESETDDEQGTDDSDDEDADENADPDSEAESDEESSESEEAAEDESGEDDPDDSSPTLPDNYRRSLHAYGWQDDEIDQNVEALGKSFIDTAERIHENRNKELQQFAKAGREAKEQTDEGQKGSGGSEQQAASGQKSSEGLPESLNKIDPDKLKEQYGEDELIDAIVGPVNQTIDSLNGILPQVQQGQQAAQQAQVEQVEKQVEGFFGREDMQTYNDLYGDANQGLTDEQLQKRNELLDTAYNISVGAQQLHGQELPLDQAMQNAHEIVAKDYKAQAERQKVKKTAKTRSRGKTQKPSRKKGSAASKNDGPPETRDELVQRTSSRLSQAFSDS